MSSSGEEVPMVEPKDSGLILYAVTILMLVLSWLAVFARFAIRSRTGTIGNDDWLMLAGAVLYTVTAALIIMVCLYGAGYMAEDLTTGQISMGTKYYFIAQIFYVSCTAPIKLSICVALYRIAGINNIYRWTLWAIAGLTVATAVITIIGVCNVCHPTSAMWLGPATACNYDLNSGIGYFLSAVSIVTDWALAILPAFMLWNVQLKSTVKVSVATVLALGAFASCATIVRLKFLVLYEDGAEFMYSTAKIAVWSMLEEGIGITAGSMPMMRPLLRYIPFIRSSGFASSDKYRSSGPGGTHPTTGNKSRRNRKRGGDGTAHQLEAISRVERAEGTVGAASSTGDGDSQRHILKETEFTVSSEPYKGPEGKSWNYNRIEE